MCTSAWHCFTLDTRFKCKDALSDSIISFKTVSDMGWPVVGKAAIGSTIPDGMPSLEAWGPLTSMSLLGETLWGLNLAGLRVVGLEVLEYDPLYTPAGVLSFLFEL